MTIDWFTFIAQIINFGILIGLLQRFLYQPVLRAMEQREQNIAYRLEEAARKMQEAQQEAERYRQKQQEWEAQRQALFSQASNEVESWKKTMLQRGQEEVEQSRARWQEAMQQQQQSFWRHLQQEACQQVLNTVRLVLADLANAELEQQVVEIFLERLQHLKAEAVHNSYTLNNHHNHNNHHGDEGVDIVIASAFDIPPATQKRIEQRLHQKLASSVNLHFQTIPDLICGIQLQAKGYKLAWSMENYLSTLEESLSNLLAEETHKSESS